MKLSLAALEALDAIDRQGSLAAAARQLNRVPSALPYAVQRLGQDLDVLLFDRHGHRAVLTEAGREWLREGRHLLAASGELECRVRQIAKGWEAVVAVNTLLPLAPLLEPLPPGRPAAGSVATATAARDCRPTPAAHGPHTGRQALADMRGDA